MKKDFFLCLMVFCVLFFPYQLTALLDFLSVSGNPAPMKITTAVAGSPPNSVSDNSTTYSITTLGINEKITGQLNTSMPSGVSLKITLQAPSGATSLGAIALTTTPQNLVTNLPLLSLLVSGLSISYQLSASVNAGPISSRSVVVTLTVG